MKNLFFRPAGNFRAKNRKNTGISEKSISFSRLEFPDREFLHSIHTFLVFYVS